MYSIWDMDNNAWVFAVLCDSAEGWDQTDRHKSYLQIVNLHRHFLLNPLYQRLYIHVVFWDMFATL